MHEARPQTPLRADDDLLALVMLLEGRRAVALTGAGISTDSGIPDYRGEGTRRRARNPMRFQEFTSSTDARRRYWARAYAGWSRISTASPNPGHLAVAALERAGRLRGVITQNVDRLHQRAGSSDVVELHGALHEVRCLACEHRSSREEVQSMMEEQNPRATTGGSLNGRLNPDGDVELSRAEIEGFTPPACPVCAGPLKPDVVYFGEPVPPTRVDAAWELFNCADVLLVAGSSLTVFSGYRFVREAHRRGMPVAIVNRGPTRGDSEATVCVDAGCSESLALLAQAFDAPLDPGWPASSAV